MTISIVISGLSIQAQIFPVCPGGAPSGNPAGNPDAIVPITGSLSTNLFVAQSNELCIQGDNLNNSGCGEDPEWRLDIEIPQNIVGTCIDLQFRVCRRGDFGQSNEDVFIYDENLTEIGIIDGLTGVEFDCTQGPACTQVFINPCAFNEQASDGIFSLTFYTNGQISNNTVGDFCSLDAGPQMDENADICDGDCPTYTQADSPNGNFANQNNGGPMVTEACVGCNCLFLDYLVIEYLESDADFALSADMICIGDDITLSPDPTECPQAFSVDGGMAGLSGTMGVQTFTPTAPGTYELCNTSGNAACPIIECQMVTVFPSPTITDPSDSPITCAGTPVEFMATPSGGVAPYTFQWEFSTDGVNYNSTVDGADYSGSNTSTLTVLAPPLALDGAVFRVIATDANGCMITSNPATLNLMGCEPELTIFKTVAAGSPTTGLGADGTLTDGGDQITYSYEVCNTGQVTVNDVSVNDPGPTFNGVPGTNALSAPICGSTTLLIGECTTCTAVYTLSQTDVDNGSMAPNSVNNSATATGTDPDGDPYESDPDEAVADIPPAPSLAFTKSVSDLSVANGDLTAVTDAGDIISFEYEVTNDGNVTINNIMVKDAGPTFGTPGVPGTNALSAIICSPTTLAPGESVTCSASYIITQADIDNSFTGAMGGDGSFMNTANATGEDPSGGPVDSPNDDADGDIPSMPMLAMEKEAAPISIGNGVDPNLPDGGDVIAYTYTVENTGNVMITNIVINDSGPTFNGMLGTGTLAPIVCTPTSLAPGEVATCTTTYTLSQADVDEVAGDPPFPIMNTATASGEDPNGDAVESPPDSEESELEGAPMLEIEKSASAPTQPILAGSSTITYTYEVCNTGNVTINNIAIIDDGPAFNGSPGTGMPATVAAANNLGASASCTATSLIPGACATCTAQYVMSQADINNGAGIPGGVTNIANAEGDGPNGTVESPDDEAETMFEGDPMLALVKSVAMPLPDPMIAGSTITYNYMVENTGNVLISNVSVNDPGPTFSGANGTNALSAIICMNTTLSPMESTTCSATYILSQSDIDNAAGAMDGAANIATAEGEDPSGDPVESPPDDESFDVPSAPSLDFQKSIADISTSNGADGAVIDEGDVITFEYVVTNDGTVSIDNIVVNDAGPVFGTPPTPGTNNLSTPVCIPTTLAPGESATCTASYILSQVDIDNSFAGAGAGADGSFTNTANASGTDPTGTGVDSPDDDADGSIPSNPMLEFDKASEPPSVINGADGTVTDAGDEIIYTYTVENTGNVTLNNIMVNDPGPAFGPAPGTPGENNAGFAVVCMATTLTPGETTTCTATYVLTQADIDNAAGVPDGVVNTADAQGDDPTGETTVSDPDTDMTEIPSNPMLVMVKSVDPPAAPVAAGSLLNYTYEVCNTGNVSIDNITINDDGPFFNGIAGQGLPPSLAGNNNLGATALCVTNSLIPGECTTCAATYTLSQEDVDNGASIPNGVANIASASGDGPTGAVDSEEDDAVTMFDGEPLLNIEKSIAMPLPDPMIEGSLITYQYVVSNGGTVTISNVSVNDPGPTFGGANGTNALSAITCTATTLLPGQSTMCTAVYALSQTDIDNAAGIADGAANTASAEGTDPTGTPTESEPDDETFDVPNDPSLDFAKSVSDISTSSGALPAVTDAGDIITFEYIVINDGNVNISNIVVNDPGPVFGNPGITGTNNLSAIICSANALGPGEMTSCTATYILSQIDIENSFIGAAADGEFMNTANASGEDPSGGPVDSDDATADGTIPALPALDMEKDAAPITISNGIDPTLPDGGDIIVYTYTVENTGNVTITDIIINDVGPTFNGMPGTGTMSAPITCTPMDLAPGESATCTATYTLSQADVNEVAGDPPFPIMNTATAQGDGPNGPVISPEDSQESEIIGSPMLEIEKSASAPTTPILAGVSTIAYSYEVCNTGNVTLDNISIIDDGPSFNGVVGTGTPANVAGANALGMNATCGVTSLDPGDCTTCMASYTMSQDDINNGAGIPGGVMNSASSTGDGPNGPVDSPEDDAETMFEGDPMLTIEKSVVTPLPSPMVAGSTITYMYVVENTGNVTLDNISVNDPGPTFNGANGTNSLSAIICLQATLDPQESTTCQATYVLSQTDIDNAAGLMGAAQNTATAEGDDPSGTPTESEPDDEMFDVPNDPSLAFEKNITNAGPITMADEIINFEYIVTNDGNVSIANIVVNDVGPVFGTPGVPGTNALSAIICIPNALAPGESTTCNATYVVSQADIDNALAGAPVGGPGTFMNEANATGTDPLGGTVDSPDDVAMGEVESNPMLDIDKQAAPPTVISGANGSITDEGDQILYSYIIENTGNVTINNISVVDPGPSFGPTPGVPGTDNPLAIVCPLTTLLPGEITTCTAIYTISLVDLNNGAGVIGGVVNTANAEGEDPTGAIVESDPDTEVVEIPASPMLELEKSVAPIDLGADGLLSAGDIISYSYEVCNTGNVSIDNIAVNDPGPTFNGVLGENAATFSANITCADAFLDPSICTLCTADYVLTAGDIANGAGIPNGVMNTASSEGTDPQGNLIESEEDEAETELPCDLYDDWISPTPPVCDTDGPLPEFSLIAPIHPLLDDGVDDDAQVIWSGTIISSGQTLTAANLTDNGVTATFDPVGLSGFVEVCVTGRINNNCEAEQCYSFEIVEQPELPESTSINRTCEINTVGSVSISQLFAGFDIDDPANSDFALSASPADALVGSAIVYNEPGCYEVTLTYTGSCVPAVAEVTSYVLVAEQPQPSFDIQNEVCLSASDAIQSFSPQYNSPAPYAADPADIAIVWTIVDNVTGATATINPATGEVTLAPEAAAGDIDGNYEITLTETISYSACGSIAAGTCEESFSITVDVEDGTNQDASFTIAPNPLCVDDVPAVLTPVTNGGVFTGIGVTDNGLGTGGTFDPTITGPGIHQVDYILNSDNGCTNVFSLNVEVLEEVNADLVDIHIECQLAPSGSISLSGLFTTNTTTNGQFTLINGPADASVTGNTLIYTAAGCYEVMYEVSSFDGADGSCLASSTGFVLITEQPQPSFDIQNEVCLSASDADQSFSPQYNSPAPYTADPADIAIVWTIVDNVTGATATINPATGEVTLAPEAAAGDIDGNYEITLTETISYSACGSIAAGTCEESFSITVDVEDGTNQDASFTIAPNPLCVDDVPAVLTPVTNGGVFTGIGVTNNGLGTGGTFDPTITGPGIYQVDYILNTDNGCTNVFSLNVEVLEEVNADLTDIHLECQLAPSGSLSLSGLFTPNTTTSGQFTLVSGPSSALVNGNTLIYTEAGCYEVMYEVSSFDGADESCSAASIGFVLITEQPQPSFDIEEQVCFSDGDADLLLIPNINSPLPYDDFGIFSSIWTLTDAVVGATATIDAANGQITLVDDAGPADINGLITVCYTEELDWSSCGVFASSIGGTDGDGCAEQICLDIVVADGTAVDASFTLDNDEPCIGETVTFTANVPGGQFSGPGVIDNEDGMTATVTITECGDIPVTYSITAAGNEGCFSQNTFVLRTDRTAPVINPEDAAVDLTEECDGMGNQDELNAWLIENGGASATDNCTFTWSNELLTVESGCGETEVRTYNFIATDECGNTSTTSANFIIEDSTAPVIACPMSTNGTTDFYNCEGDVDFLHPTPTDACGLAIYHYTITDPDGTVNGPFDIIGLLSTGALDASFDFEEGVSIVSYYVEDACGNDAACSFEVTIGDPLAPFFLDCPADVFVGNDPDECSAKVNWDTPIAADNCDVPADPDQLVADTSLTVTQLFGSHNGSVYDDITSGEVVAVGTYLVGYVVLDTDGNSDTCQFNVTVWDTQDPILTAGLPEDLTLSCDIQLDTFVLLAHQIADNCVANPTIENTLVSTRVIDPDDCGYYNYQDTFFYTVTDSSQLLPDGSVKINQMEWKWVVTWIDTTAPSIILPPDTIVQECQVIPVETCKTEQIIIGTRDTTVVVDEKWVLITVVDKKDTMICDTIFQPIPFEDQGYGIADAIDNCAPRDSLRIVDYADFTYGPGEQLLTYRDEVTPVCKGDKAFVVNRIWIAKDPCGNVDSAIQVLEVIDRNPPEIICKEEITVSLDQNGSYNLNRDDVLFDYFDACFTDPVDVDVLIQPNFFNCQDVKTHNVIVSATDACNNRTSYCEVVVNVIDIIAPTILCPQTPVIIDVNPNNCDTAFDIASYIQSEDCDVVIKTDPPINGGLPLGLSTMRITATDATGNSNTCTIDVDVQLTEIIEFDVALACNDRINISLGGECELMLTPDLILEGDPSLCSDLLCVEVRDENDVAHINFFDESDIDQLFKVRIVDCNGSGNSCWAEVLIEEKLVPIIDWPLDTTIICIEPQDPSYHKLGEPVVLNCESAIDIRYQDNFIDYDRCDNPRARIERTWIVVDDDKPPHRDTHTQVIDIIPFNNEHVVFPEDITASDPISCQKVSETLDDIENGVLPVTSVLHPDSTGIPDAFGISLLDNAGLCLFNMGYEDRVLEGCGSSFSIVRTWEILDLCKPASDNNPIAHEQIIVILDVEAPIIAKDTLDLIVSISPWSCTFSGELPLPELLDNCGGLEFEAYASGGGYIETTGSIIDGTLRLIGYNFEEGLHRVNYVYKDGCGNIGLFDYQIEVRDEVIPVAVCADNLKVSITGGSEGGEAKIYAESVDGGSHDAGCGPVTTCMVKVVDFEAGLLNTLINGRLAYRAVNTCSIDGELRDTLLDKNGLIESIDIIPYVLCKDALKFCCGDIGTQMVAFHAIDDQGLSNVCMAQVTVDDKTSAQLNCQPHSISCTDDKDTDLGSPIESNSLCGEELPLKFFDDSSFLSGCGDGQIFRVWYLDTNGDDVKNDDETHCNQVVSVTNPTSFDPYTIKWPKHHTGEVYTGVNIECNDDDLSVELEQEITVGNVFSCSAAELTDGPIWCNTSCGMVGVSSEVDTVVASDACLKLIKRWTVIDWCYWEVNGGDVDDENDGAGDEFQAVEDWAQGSCAGCEENVSPDPVYFRYTKVDRDGYYTYDQVIKIVDDTAPVIEVSDLRVNTIGGAISKDDDTSCSGRDVLTATATDHCDSTLVSSELLSWVITYDNGSEVNTSRANGASVSIETQAGRPGDEHTVTLETADGCGNRTTETVSITFGDEKPPVPLCISGITTAFMDTDGTAVIRAKEFDLGSFDNCSDLSYSVVLSGETPASPDSASFEEQASISFSCADLTNFYDLDIWVWDSSGNGDYCTVAILIGGSCDDSETPNGTGALISGSIYTENNDLVENTSVALASNELAEYPKLVLTGSNGNYAFANNPLGFEYSITPRRDDNHINGISTLDILLIQRHILDLGALDSPYKIIASDINNDQSTSAADLIDLRRLILGITTRFANNESWRFVSESSNLFEETSPWPFLEFIYHQALTKDLINQNFIAIKVGDVNGDVVANSFMKAEIRSAEKSLTAVDQSYVAGEEVMIPIYAHDINSFEGLQFTLEHNGLEFIELRSDAINIGTDHIGIHSEALTLSWENVVPVTQLSDALFELKFMATQDGQVSKSITLSSNITTSEIYQDGETAGLSLHIERNENQDKSAVLYQNDPNPFITNTTVKFELPQASRAMLVIYDVNGQERLRFEDGFVKGINEVKINHEDLLSIGLYYYQLSVDGQFIDSKKMMVIK